MREAAVGAVAGYLDRQELTVAARAGAGHPDPLNTKRWVRELLQDDPEVGREAASEYIEQVAQWLRERPGDLPFVRALYAYLRASWWGPVEPPEGVKTRARAGWREVTPDGRDHYVYRLYDQAARLLYVGVTDRGPVRLAEHYRTKEWFYRVARVDLQLVATRAAAEATEAELIRRLRPEHNVVFNRA